MTADEPPATPVRTGRRKIGAFLLLTFGWSWLFWGPKALAAEGLVAGVPALPELGAFGPTVAAFVLVTYTNGVSGARRLARRAVRLDFPKRWLIPALFLSPLIVLISLGVALTTGAALSFPWTGTPIVLPIAFLFVFFLGGPVQEEFGWRGYLLDPVQDRLSALGGGVAVGLVGAVWHIPLFFIPSETIYYQNPFVGFAVSITLLSVLMTWVYNNTNASLLPALLFHASFNWSQGMFPILDSDRASLTLVGLLAVTTLAVVAYWGPTSLTRTDAA
jgi:membrane protease YdiL (CAAX protease family)